MENSLWYVVRDDVNCRFVAKEIELKNVRIVDILAEPFLEGRDAQDWVNQHPYRPRPVFVSHSVETAWDPDEDEKPSTSNISKTLLESILDSDE